MAATLAAATIPWTAASGDLPVLRKEEDAREMGDGVERDRRREQAQRVARRREVGPVDEGHERLADQRRAHSERKRGCKRELQAALEDEPEDGLLSGRSRESTG